MHIASRDLCGDLAVVRSETEQDEDLVSEGEAEEHEPQSVGSHRDEDDEQQSVHGLERVAESVRR